MSFSAKKSLAGTEPISSSRIPVYQYVTELCKLKDSLGETIQGFELAQMLNLAGFLTSRGTAYVDDPSRGIFAVVSRAWNWLMSQGLTADAEIVAHTIVDIGGKPAWQRER